MAQQFKELESEMNSFVDRSVNDRDGGLVNQRLMSGELDIYELASSTSPSAPTGPSTPLHPYHLT
jgi:hypothetical protein